jgi:DNA-binding Lrp family transcriptional regulator
MSWLEVLRAVPDVTAVRPVGPGRLSVEVGGRLVDVGVHRVDRPPRPNEVAGRSRPGAGPWVFVAPHLTAGVRRELERAGWWWADEEAAAIRADGRWMRLNGDVADSDPGWLSRRRADVGIVEGRPPARSDLAVVRLLITCPDVWTQTALADRIGVSQPAISKALGRLRERGLIDGDSRVIDPEGACVWWVSGYRGPSGLVSHWYSLDDAWTTTDRLMSAASSDAVVSGATAADVLAPWLAPDRAVIYSTAGIDPPAGLVAVDRAQDAVATTIVTADRDLYWHHPDASAASPTGLPIQLADPLQVLWDLTRWPTDDPGRRDEAADHLLDRIVRQAKTR